MTQPNPSPTAINAIQQRAIGEALAALSKGHGALVEAPTGAGKTRILSKIVEQGKFDRVLVLSGREALANQLRGAFEQWVPGRSTSIATGGNLNQDASAVFATVQTAAARSNEIGHYDAVIIDEAHHASEPASGRKNDYSEVIEAVLAKNPNAKNLAATATPIRPDKKHLHPIIHKAQRVVIGLRELEDAGQIVLPQTKMLSLIGEDGRNMRHAAGALFDPMADQNYDGVNKALRQARPQDFHYQVAQQWMLSAGNLQTIAFEERIEDARRFAEELKAMGVKAAVIDSKQSTEQNQALLDAYAAGKIQVLSSVSMIDEGIDVPSTRCTLILRGTTSAIQYAQMAGRSMRGRGAAANVKPLVLDAGLSTMIHGAIEQRAAVTAYFQKLQQSDLHDVRMKGENYLPHQKGSLGYSPWKLLNKQPPILAMTDGSGTLFARAMRAPDGGLQFALAEASEIRGRSQLQMLRAEDGRPLRSINGFDLESIEASKVLPSRSTIIRLASSQTQQGRTLQEERIDADAQKHMASFAAMSAAAASKRAVAQR